jgi:hypothetical protein
MRWSRRSTRISCWRGESFGLPGTGGAPGISWEQRGKGHFGPLDCRPVIEDNILYRLIKQGMVRGLKSVCAIRKIKFQSLTEAIRREPVGGRSGVVPIVPKPASFLLAVSAVPNAVYGVTLDQVAHLTSRVLPNPSRAAEKTYHSEARTQKNEAGWLGSCRGERDRLRV